MAVKVSLGIIAYNEEANIGVLLDTVLKDAPRPEVLTEIFVVASGCTDCTEDIVRGFVKKDSRIKLIVQSERKGKASAINLFFSATTGDILILESTDTVPAQGTLSRIMAAFDDPEVGMAGGHPVPVNPEYFYRIYRASHVVFAPPDSLGEAQARRIGRLSGVFLKHT